MNSLNAISPIDGRYRSKVEALAGFFSEGALIRYRVRVEIEYFIALGQLPQLPLHDLFAQRPQLPEQLRAIYQNFSDDDALEIKEIEKTTNHDVKAVEYFIKRRFDNMQLEAYKEFIHFGLTSQDEKIIIVGDKVGYTTTSSPFFCLNEGIETGRIKRGDTILFWTIGAGQRY